MSLPDGVFLKTDVKEMNVTSNTLSSLSQQTDDLHVEELQLEARYLLSMIPEEYQTREYRIYWIEPSDMPHTFCYVHRGQFALRLNLILVQTQGEVRQTRYRTRAQTRSRARLQKGASMRSVVKRKPRKSGHADQSIQGYLSRLQPDVDVDAKTSLRRVEEVYEAMAKKSAISKHKRRTEPSKLSPGSSKEMIPYIRVLPSIHGILFHTPSKGLLFRDVNKPRKGKFKPLNLSHIQRFGAAYVDLPDDTDWFTKTVKEFNLKVITLLRIAAFLSQQARVSGRIRIQDVCCVLCIDPQFKALMLPPGSTISDELETSVLGEDVFQPFVYYSNVDSETCLSAVEDDYKHRSSAISQLRKWTEESTKRTAWMVIDARSYPWFEIAMDEYVAAAAVPSIQKQSKGGKWSPKDLITCLFFTFLYNKAPRA